MLHLWIVFLNIIWEYQKMSAVEYSEKLQPMTPTFVALIIPNDLLHNWVWQSFMKWKQLTTYF